jgi:hypothetical protein
MILLRLRQIDYALAVYSGINHVSESHSHIQNPGPTAELEIIKQKRQALQNLIKITAMLNRLHQGLQAVLLMGQSAAGITGKLIEKFREYSDRLNSHPTDTLKNTLNTTEIRLQQNIKQVIEISQKSEDELKKQLAAKPDKSSSLAADTNIEDYVEDFKKKAQTSIALRITLKTRNVLLKAFNLPVPEAFIEKQLAILDVREAECKKRIQQDMTSLDSDIDNMLGREDCPDEIKQKLLLIKNNLQQNISHFAAGKNIDEMPMMYESIELAAPARDVEQFEAATNPTPAVATESSVPQKKSQKLGLTGKMMAWLKSPMHVKWKDLDKK